MDKIGREPASSEVTPEHLHLRRREFIKNSLLFAATSTGVGGSLLWLLGGRRGGRVGPFESNGADRAGGASREIDVHEVVERSPYSTSEPMTPFRDVTSYNNFYEFGTNKGDPAANADTLRTRPWTVAIEGEVNRPQVVDIEQLIKWAPLEERIYRMRCVETWSMVVPCRVRHRPCRAPLVTPGRSFPLASGAHLGRLKSKPNLPPRCDR